MAESSTGDGSTGFVDETTSLLASGKSPDDESNNNNGELSPLNDQNALPTVSENFSLEASNGTNEANQRLWEEMDRPWPSTFERSISLLASPILQVQQVDMFTKSPKPGSTPAALARRRNLERGFYTPEIGVSRLRSKSFGIHVDDDEYLDDSVRKMEPEKLQTLEYWKSQAGISIEKVQKEQKQKAAKAKEYRQQLIKQTQKEKEKEPTTDAHGAPAIKAETTFAQCVFNLANILMGMGLLGLPYAFTVSGSIGGGLSLFIFGFITWRTSVMIGRELNGDPRPSSFFTDSPYKTPLPPGSDPRARMYPPVSSFPDIARASFGSGVCTILSALLYFELFSCDCIFLVSIGDHLHELFPAYSQPILVVLATIVSLVPTVLLRTPALLSYFSLLGTTATIIVVLVVIGSAVFEGDISEEVAEKMGLPESENLHIKWRPQGLVLALGIVSYCFSGHAIVPSIYTSMRKPQDFEKMVTYTFTFVVGACFAVAISGYYMFGSTVQDQVTLSLKTNSSAVRLMDGLTGLMVLTAFSKLTLTMFPLAIGLEEIIAPFLTSDRMVAMCSVTIKVTLTILAALVAIFFPSFSVLCAITGMICTMSVSVIFPAAAHYKLFHTRLSFWEKLEDIVMVIVGSALAIVGTIMTLK